MKTITLKRDDYKFWNSDTTLLIKKPYNYNPNQMDAENKIPYWISKRWAGHWGYCDDDGHEFKAIFI